MNRLRGMRAHRGRIAAAAAALSIGLGGADAVAAEPLPVGEARGVRIERHRGELVVVFTRRAAALHRRLAGKRVRVECTDDRVSDRKGVHFGGSSGAAFHRVPRTRRTMPLLDRTRGVDYCRLFLAARTVRRGDTSLRKSEELIVSVPLTQAGAVLLDEETRGFAAFGLLLLAGELADRRTPSAFPTPDRLVAWADAKARGRRHPYVALASPAETPAPGDYGYWSDGRDAAAVVTLTSSGRRLFFELLADDEIRTNMPWLLSGELR